jgi:hypothetical protein
MTKVHGNPHGAAKAKKKQAAKERQGSEQIKNFQVGRVA